MKKLLFGVCIAVAAVSCKPKETPPAKTALTAAAVITASPMISLNGIPFAEASKMINAFQKNKLIKSKHTSIWFSKEIFNGMTALLYKLKKEGIPIDGIRIYFAKDTNGNENTAVLVATYADPESAEEEGEENIPHRDYFNLTADYLSSNNVRGKASQIPVAEATLYNNSYTCPPESTTGCDASRVHYISCDAAHAMVKKYANDIIDTEKDIINATSEWFDLGVINDLNNEINSNSSADGVRLYFAKRTVADKLGVFRHGFLFITTENGEKDYYKCFEIHPIYNKNLLVPNKDGYDNGEQCPTNCNVVTWPSK
jgi:hypothetical protein